MPTKALASKPATKKTPVTQLVTAKPPRKAPAKKAKPIVYKNEIAFILDGSGSMSRLTKTLVAATNSWLDKIERENDAQGQITNVTRIDFGVDKGTHGNIDIVKFSQPIADFDRLDRFNAYGNTPLFDAVTLGIEKLSQFENNDNTSMLVITVTDGEENASSANNVRNIGKLLRSKQAKKTWTFVFMVPPGMKDSFCRTYEIPLDNVTEWEPTTQGMQRVEEKTSKGIGAYFGSRAMGFTSSESFYSQTDMSEVTPKDVKKACTDISNQCQVFEVPKEQQISEFVEAKTGFPYRGKDGKAFYQLTKKEEVQPSKQVLIMEKGKRAIFGGTEARELVGLHNNATDKVTPGNHANYDIFVQSTSNNRALVRGTKLIVKS